MVSTSCTAPNSTITQRSILCLNSICNQDSRGECFPESGGCRDLRLVARRLVSCLRQRESRLQIGGGIWIGNPSDEKSWWRVPGSEPLAVGQFNSLIEQLRASSPKWALDEERFAFVLTFSDHQA